MKKSYEPPLATRLAALCVVVAFTYASCSFDTLFVEEGQLYSAERPHNLEPSHEAPHSSVQAQETARQIRALDTAKILSTLSDLKAEIPETVLSAQEELMLDLFLGDPEKALELMAREENGEAIVALVSAMFTEGSIDEAVRALEILEPELAREFVTVLDEVADILNFENRPVNVVYTRSVSYVPNIREFPIILTAPADQGISRGLSFNKDLNGGTFGLYAGISLATAIGAVVSKSWIPWVNIAGTVAMVAGALSMAGQMNAWVGGAITWNVVRNIGTVTAIGTAQEKIDNGLGVLIISDQIGMAYAVIAITIAVAVVCAKSLIGNPLLARVQSLFARIMESIQSSLPPGLKISINGIQVNNAPPIAVEPAIPVPTFPPAPPSSKPVWYKPWTWGRG